MDSERMTINIHEILNKIIESGERSLDMQGEFLKAVYELKSRFDAGDRDHVTFQKELQDILTHTTAMHDRMKSASNETIIKMLDEHDKRSKGFEVAINDFKHTLEAMGDVLHGQSGYHDTLKDISTKVSDLSSADKRLKWIVSAITLIISAASAVIITMNQMSINIFKAETAKVIQEIKTDVNKVHEDAHKEK